MAIFARADGPQCLSLVEIAVA